MAEIQTIRNLTAKSVNPITLARPSRVGVALDGRDVTPIDLLHDADVSDTPLRGVVDIENVTNFGALTLGNQASGPEPTQTSRSPSMKRNDRTETASLVGAPGNEDCTPGRGLERVVLNLGRIPIVVLD